MSTSTTVQEHHTMQAPVSPLLRFLARVTAVVVALVVVVALDPAGVRAAVYELEQCTPARPGYSGWVQAGTGLYVRNANNCGAPDGVLSASFDAPVQHNAGDMALWRFTPPTNTSLASVRVDNRVYNSGPGGADILVKRDGSTTIETCAAVQGCGQVTGAKTYEVDDASEFSFGVYCTAPSTCPADDAHARVSGIHVRIKDDIKPSLSDVSGPLVDPSTTARVRRLAFTATDAGGGVYRRRLVVDDVPQAAATISTNNGACEEPFTVRIPCPLSVSSEFDVDTSIIGDGPHVMALRVTDATDQNVAESVSWTIWLDNHAPTVATPAITGSPSVGQPLSCSADVDGQSPSVTHQWLRAVGDGSTASPIGGATAATYTVTPGDAGHRLICRVTATDAGGSTTRESTMTPAASAPGTLGSVRFVLTKETLTFAKRRARWTTSAFTAKGRLTDPAGQPIRGLSLRISQSVNGRRSDVGVTTSAADGSWAFKVPRGPSRTITIAAGDGVNAATTTIQQRVSAHVTFRAVHKRIRRGGGVLFRGTLHGGHVNTREKLIEFQVHYRGAWQTIGTLRTDRKGRFAVRYRFGSAAYGRYTFRVRTLPTLGYPFAVGVSRGKAATVRVG